MNASSLRPMFITNSLSGGGAERATNILVDQLWENGISVTLVAINLGPRDILYPRCRIYELNRPWRGGVLGTFKSYLKLRFLIKNENPSHLILNCDLPEFLGTLLFTRRRKIIVEHSSSPWITRKFFGRCIRRLAQLQGTCFVAVSDHLRIWPNMKVQKEVIRNPVKLGLYSSEEYVKNFENSIKRLVFIGRLSPEKRPMNVLKIANHCKLPVLLIGDGKLRKNLEEFASILPISVEFAGQLLNPWSQLTPNDLLIVTSQYEGDGLVVLEALETQTPLLISKIPDLLRFQLPTINYVEGIEEAVQVISKHINSIGAFIVPSQKRSEILSERDPRTIGDQWIDYLKISCT